MTGRAMLLGAAVVLLASPGWIATAQQGGLRIVSPAPDELASGPMTLHATIDPGVGDAAVESLTFYVDGAIVCASVPAARGTCAWNAGSEVQPHLVRVVADLRAGGRLVTSVRTGALEHVESVRVTVVHAGAIVTDGDGNLVRGLTRESFRLFDEDEPRPITHFSADDAPLELLLAVDVSGSMEVALADLRTAVRAFVGAMRPQDRATLIAFNENLYQLTGREADAAARLEAVEALTAWGGTALYDAMGEAIDMMQAHAGRRGIVLFTDGADEASSLSLPSLQRKLEASDAMLFMVALGQGTRDPALRRTLESLAESTGGRVLYADRPRELAGRFQTVLQELAHQYVLGFDPPAVTGEPPWRVLRVETIDRRYRVRARKGYRPPVEE